MKPIGPLRPRPNNLTLQGRETAVVEVQLHGSVVGVGTIAELLQAMVKLLQGEDHRGHLRRGRRGAHRGLRLKKQVVLSTCETLRGVPVLALRLAPRNVSLRTALLGGRVNFANNFSMSAMTWIRVRKLRWN